MTISMTCDEPAAADKAIVFACDANYARFAIFAASQIAVLHPDRDFDICISSADALTVPQQLAHLRLRICTISTGELFAALRWDGRRTDATYLRLALPAAFEGEYRRILYLDSDVFVQGGDFSALLDADIRDHVLAAVRDNSQWRTPTRRIDSFGRLGLPATPYFNAGVLLIDVARFEARNVRARGLAFAQAHPGGMLHMDQDMLNGALMGEWAELSPVWNWQYTWASRMFELAAGANVIHFIGPKKPWTHVSGELPLKFRNAYRAFFEAHYSELQPLGPDGPSPGRNRRFLRKSLVKHLLSSGKMCAYLDRFEDDRTVLH